MQKNEVDILFKTGNQFVPIEIKSSKTFNSDFLKKIKFFQNLVQERAPLGYLIYACDQTFNIQSIQVINYKDAAKEIFMR